MHNCDNISFILRKPMVVYVYFIYRNKIAFLYNKFKDHLNAFQGSYTRYVY